MTWYRHPSIRNGMPNFLPADRVRFVGEPVAFLVADSRYDAEDLAALVQIEYRELPVLATVEDALAPDAPQLHPDWVGNIAASFSYTGGDASRAMASAARIDSSQIQFCPADTTPARTARDRGGLRPHARPTDSVDVHPSTLQCASEPRERPRPSRISGSRDSRGCRRRFWCEIEDISGRNRRQPSSRLLKRPVKWIEDRFESLQATTHSRAIDIDLELGCALDGRFTAMKAKLTLDVGGYVFTSGIMTSEIAGAHLSNAYRIPNFGIDVQCVGTNKTPIATYRGAGQPESCFPTECLIDVLAKEVGLPAVELRRRNMIVPPMPLTSLARRCSGAR